MSGREAEPTTPKLEIDERFPSGQWKGFYLQRGAPGRQWMSLALEFCDGWVAGEGRDSVGEFLVRGTYDLKTGHCSLIKTYPASHDVLYTGSNEGDGKWLWGVWRIHIDSGGFHLWPRGEEDPTQDRTAAAKDVPAQRKVRLELTPA